MRPLMIGPGEREAIARVKQAALEKPVDVATLPARLATGEGKMLHMAQMTAQSIELPIGFFVTYSVEVQPVGLCHHISISTDGGPGRVPNPYACEMIAHEFGIPGGFADWDRAWPEELKGHRSTAINIVHLMGLP
jgi:hypothetical protein